MKKKKIFNREKQSYTNDSLFFIVCGPRHLVINTILLYAAHHHSILLQNGNHLLYIGVVIIYVSMFNF